MPEKPIALIVDDDKDWLETMEDGLSSDFQILKAKTLSEVNKVIDNKGIKIEIALVDIKLDETKINDDSGLSAMFSLNKTGIPCIATTSSNNGDAVRAALMTGRAKDVWFKSERLVVLKEKVENIGNRLNEERKEAVETIGFTNEFTKLSKNLLSVTFVVLSLIVGTAYLFPNNFIAVTSVAVGLIILIFSTLALFYNKITGEQFVQLIKTSQNKIE